MYGVIATPAKRQRLWSAIQDGENYEALVNTLLITVELGSQKKEIGNTSVHNIIRVPGVTGYVKAPVSTPLKLFRFARFVP
ncbi:hypothetical protein NQ315_000616 [Exocentrus adspersus]|uniref:Uncharacterized protein n=1 Tax=Exocentrus adspersus TaxID=1586481 RepID=A0AAV8VP04_9CUCU|nr:hypothetical protein NQ315_000616 [Exocentrus adspersus]